MSRFNVRPITVIPALPEMIPSNKKPSAYLAFKNRESNVVVMPSAPPPSIEASVSEPAPEKTRRGRMTKDEARRHKMDLALAGIQVLVVSKPNRNKIREYIKNRILQLDDEKR